MKRSVLWFVILGLIICSGIVWWEIHRIYYFNPFTFRKDAVSWNNYKNPMELDIVYQPITGTQTRYTTENQSQIDYVLAQLKTAKPTSYKPILGRPGGQIWIQFRNPVSQASYVDAIIPDNGKVALLSQTQPITVTSGLKEFILEKQSQSKPMN